MEQEVFFKPTPVFKEYMILDLIEKNVKITQRKISTEVKAAVSLVNEYLGRLERKGYIQRNYISSKIIEYVITPSGKTRRKFLNIGYLKDLQTQYSIGEKNISCFIEEIYKRGYKEILLYGAGEVAEILLSVINEQNDNFVSVINIVDDKTQKKALKGVKIVPLEQIFKIPHDGILISSFTHQDQMKKKLKTLDYPVKKIIEFF